MFELFDEVFGEVMEKIGASGWWEVYDSDPYDTVFERIAERMGITTDELGEREDFWEWGEREDFWEWAREMAMDL